MWFAPETWAFSSKILPVKLSYCQAVDLSKLELCAVNGRCCPALSPYQLPGYVQLKMPGIDPQITYMQNVMNYGSLPFARKLVQLILNLKCDVLSFDMVVRLHALRSCKSPLHGVHSIDVYIYKCR